MPAFDIVSKIDLQEVDNAVNQAKKEIATRYDFRNSKSTIEFVDEAIQLFADDSMKLRAMNEILTQKLAKRGLGVRAFDFKEPEQASGEALRQKVELRQGISGDDARKIVKLIKEAKLKKIQAQIQGDQVRVTAPKRDDLQGAIQLVKENIKLELQFVNFRDD